MRNTRRGRAAMADVSEAEKERDPARTEEDDEGSRDSTPAQSTVRTKGIEGRLVRGTKREFSSVGVH